MKVRPILFNTDMVRAILAGRKTTTRRICKDGNDYVVPDMDLYDANSRTYAIHSYTDKEHTDRLSLVEHNCPICPGDILYVRETWGDYRECQDGGCGYYLYRADYPDTATTYQHDGMTCDLPRWRPSIHMPKAAARIWLKVTDVRVERLQEITDEEAGKEGCFDYTSTALGFCYIWDSTIKKSDLDRYGWEVNPWVWVIEFERCEKPESEG